MEVTLSDLMGIDLTTDLKINFGERERDKGRVQEGRIKSELLRADEGKLQ